MSQLNKNDKNLLKKNVETHGGSYSGILDMEKTAVLVSLSGGAPHTLRKHNLENFNLIVQVCTGPAGDKYSHAKKWKIPCVSSSWVFDSIERGYCLPTEGYRVDKNTKSSTPTKQDQTQAGLGEVSMCSTILNPDDTMVTKCVEDTINSTAMLGEGGGLVAELKGKTTADWLAELELGRVKRAGTFLDGCRIFLSGFSEPEQVQLGRVLKYAGAVRLTQMVESITHCVHSINTNTVTTETARLMARLPDLSPHMVSVQWLVESMKLGRPVNESDYIFPAEVCQEDVPRPRQCAAPPSTQPETGGGENTQFERRLLAQHGDTSTEPADTSSLADLSRMTPFLDGKKIKISGFDEEYTLVKLGDFQVNIL